MGVSIFLASTSSHIVVHASVPKPHPTGVLQQTREGYVPDGHSDHCRSGLGKSGNHPGSLDAKAALTRGPTRGEAGADFCLLGIFVPHNSFDTPIGN